MPQNVPIKFCRHCGRIIPLEAVDCPYCHKNTVRVVGKKECPFCGEPILAKAIKCKHCGEFVEGRAAAQEQQQRVIYIEQAIVTGNELPVDVQLQRPDGQRLDVQQLQGQRARLPAGRLKLPPGSAEDAAPGAGALVVVDAEGRTDGPATEESTAVREVGGPLARRGRAMPPARREPPGLPGRPVKAAPSAATEAPAPEPPPVQYECPSCRRFVFKGDSFCENCGRDLSIPRGRREFLGPRRYYAAADYALMFGTAAPLGVLLPSPMTVLLAGVAIVLGLWCLGRIGASHGQLQGTGAAAGGLAAGLFWTVMILAFA